MSRITAMIAALETSLPGLLPSILPGSRWFAGKARRIESAWLEAAVPCPGDGEPPCVLAIAGVCYQDATRERYALLVAPGRHDSGGPVLGAIEGGGEDTVLVEAMANPDAVRSLLRGGCASRGASGSPGGAALVYSDWTETARRLCGNDAGPIDVTALGGEQSNSSVRVGRNFVFKLFRKLDDGENPEVEVGRYLSVSTAFRATPPLHGALTYISPAGVASTVGVMQEWVESQGDGWQYVLARLRESATGEQGTQLIDDLRHLGQITAELHLALAGRSDDAAFAPEPVSAADAGRWQAAFEVRAAHTRQVLTRSLAAWPDEGQRLGRAVAAALDRGALARAPQVSAPDERFSKIRIHGDYHLGQTMKTARGFVLIDFEGEPGRPLAERREKHCALKDVAGMLRSLDYAAESLRRERPVLAADPTAMLRRAFFDGYMAASVNAPAPVYLPRNRAVVDAWVAFFEMDKALYELEYEINNRPAWVEVPLRGILRHLQGPS